MILHNETTLAMNRLRYRLKSSLLPFLILVLVAGAPPELDAQDDDIQMVRTLVIKNKQVLIDGRVINTDELPSAESLEGISISYSFIGVEMPVVTIGEQLYIVRENRLETIQSKSQYRDVVARQESRNKARNAKGWIVDYGRGEYYNFQGERLETKEAVPRLLNEANALYLDNLQTQNRQLFTRLTRERVLEHQADYLALAARRAETREERTRHGEALKTKLEEIFELKQQNRLAEIAQFEAELDQLKKRLERREAIKARIVEKRAARLIGQN